MLHAAFVRSDVARATITAARRVRGPASCPASSPCSRGRTSTGASARPGTRCSARSCGPSPAGRRRRPPRRRADRLRVAESRYVAEDACDLIEVDLERRSRSSTSRPRPATPSTRPRRLGLRSNAMVAVPFTPMSRISTRRSPAPRTSSRHDRQNRYLCVPMEARGIVASWAPGRDELDIVCSCQGVHETRNFFARYLGIPEARSGSRPATSAAASARRCSSSARSAPSCSRRGCSAGR